VSGREAARSGEWAQNFSNASCWFNFLLDTKSKIGHLGLGNVFIQLLCLVLKKMNLTQQKHTTQEQNGIKTRKMKLNQQFFVRIVQIAFGYHCALLYIVQHRAVLTIFRLTI